MNNEETKKWTIQQAMALNKLLDLIDTILETEVTDEAKQAQYTTKYRKILDAMFPERVEVRNTRTDG